MVFVSCDLKGSCEPSLTKKVADTLPLERISFCFLSSRSLLGSAGGECMVVRST